MQTEKSSTIPTALTRKKGKNQQRKKFDCEMIHDDISGLRIVNQKQWLLTTLQYICI